MKKVIPSAAISIMGLALLAGALATTIGASGQDESISLEQMQSILTTNGEYPDIVAKVNGDEISCQSLASTVGLLKTLTPEKPDSEIAPVALGTLIRQHVLRQAARDRGLWPTTEEVTYAVQRYQLQYDSLSKGSPAKIKTENQLAMQGIDASDVGSNEGFRLAIADSLARGRLLASIRQSVQIDGQIEDAAVAKAEDELVATLVSQSDIEVIVAIDFLLPTS